MTNYIDGFVLPIPHKSLGEYKRLVEAVAAIWIEHGALAYQEFVGDDLTYDGLRSFTDLAAADDSEVTVFGWVEFASREARDRVNEKVSTDPRIEALINSADSGFDAARMAYGGFSPLVQASGSNSG